MNTRARFAAIRLATLALCLLAGGAGAQEVLRDSGQGVTAGTARAAPPSGSDAEARGYLLRSLGARSRGKYYFEVVIDSSTSREDLEALIIARVNDGARWFGTRYDIRPRVDASVTGKGERRDGSSPKVVMGIAVDLDAGRFYRHRDGVWLGGAAPGSPYGIELRRGTSYVAELASSAPLKPFLRSGIVAVNFGNSPFLQQPPEGYTGFDSLEAAADDVLPAEAAVAFPYSLP